MSTTTAELIRKIEEIAPPSIQESWDNSGWQLNLRSANTEKLLIALEITKAVIREAKEKRADLVLVHHPLIFAPMKHIDVVGYPGQYVAELIREGISVYAAHTSFDSAAGGMNDSLARLLNLTDVGPFPGPNQEASLDMGSAGEGLGDGGLVQAIGRVGNLRQPMSFSEICVLVKKALRLNHPLRVVGDPARIVQRVALCGGGGGDLTEVAMEMGVDIYITGDVKHHQGQWAKESGLCLIDGGHWGTEKHFTDVLAEGLIAAFGQTLKIEKSALDLEPFCMV